MLELIIFVVGLFIGWSTEEPQMAKTAKAYLIGLYKSNQTSNTDKT